MTIPSMLDSSLHTTRQAALQAQSVRELTPTSGGVADLGELWRYRHLVLLLALRNLRARYKQTALGFLWAILAPVGFTTIFVLFFRIVPINAAGAIPYVPTVFAGMIIWQFFTRALMDAGSSLTANSNLITKVYFPRLALPISALLAALCDFFVSCVILVALLIIYGIWPGARLLAAPLVIAYLFILGLGFSLWLSAIDGLWRDLRHALPLLLQLGMFVSPVAYVTSVLVPEKWRGLYEWNPIVAPIEAFRWAVLGGEAPSGGALMKSAIITIALITMGTIFFVRIQRTIVDKI
jgi:lipopolysaccharide transport system permease protein